MPIFISGLAFLLKFHIRSKILFVTSSFGSHLISSSHWLMSCLPLRPLIPCIYFFHIPKALFCYLCITILVLMGHRRMLKLQIKSFNFPFCYLIDQSSKNNSFEKTPIQLLHLSYEVGNMRKNTSGFSSENEFLLKKCNL